MNAWRVRPGPRYWRGFIGIGRLIGVLRVTKLRTLDLFAGIGGFTVAGELAGGYETVAFCELDKHAQAVLHKHWPDVPIFDDVTRLHAEDIDGTVDVITGGFPCQDLSSAGRGAGLGEGTRSGLFREMLRLACEIREKQGRLPHIIFENVPRLLSGPAEFPGQWFGEFLHALAEVGYDAEWFCITAASIGAPHERERVCVAATPTKTPAPMQPGLHSFNGQYWMKPDGRKHQSDLRLCLLGQKLDQEKSQNVSQNFTRKLMPTPQKSDGQKFYYKLSPEAAKKRLNSGSQSMMAHYLVNALGQTGNVNPVFVELLMGYQANHTDLDN